MVHGCEMERIKNDVLNRKQNKICIGLKNYYALTEQQESTKFPMKSSKFEPHWEHIPIYYLYHLTSIKVYISAFAHCVGGRVYFGHGILVWA